MRISPHSVMFGRNRVRVPRRKYSLPPRTRAAVRFPADNRKSTDRTTGLAFEASPAKVIRRPGVDRGRASPRADALRRNVSHSDDGSLALMSAFRLCSSRTARNSAHHVEPAHLPPSTAPPSAEDRRYIPDPPTDVRSCGRLIQERLFRAGNSRTFAVPWIGVHRAEDLVLRKEHLPSASASWTLRAPWRARPFGLQ